MTPSVIEKPSIDFSGRLRIALESRELMRNGVWLVDENKSRTEVLPPPDEYEPITGIGLWHHGLGSGPDE